VAAARAGSSTAAKARAISVREVLAAVGRVAGRTLEVEPRPRRPRDPTEVVADARRIRAELDLENS